MPDPLLALLNPQSLGRPKGYSNGVRVPAGHDLLFVAGQVGWDGDQRIVSADFTAQFRQALRNVAEVLREAGAGPETLVRLTIYVTDKAEYARCLKEVGAAYREVVGRHFPAMTLVEVDDLLEDGAKVELEATAAVRPLPRKPA